MGFRSKASLVKIKQLIDANFYEGSLVQDGYETTQLTIWHNHPLPIAKDIWVFLTYPFKCEDCGWEGKLTELEKTDCHTSDIGVCPDCGIGTFVPSETS